MDVEKWQKVAICLIHLLQKGSSLKPPDLIFTADINIAMKFYTKAVM